MAVRSGVMTAPLDPASCHCKVSWNSRCAAWLMEGVVNGGFLVIVLHLWDCLGPWHPQNAELLNEVTLLVKTLGRPFVIAADWNCEPDDIRGCGFLDGARASLVCAGRDTCKLRVKGGSMKESEYDYWAMDSKWAWRATADLYENLSAYPHTAVQISIPWSVANASIWCVKAPKRFPRHSVWSTSPASALRRAHDRGPECQHDR